MRPSIEKTPSPDSSQATESRETTGYTPGSISGSSTGVAVSLPATKNTGTPTRKESNSSYGQQASRILIVDDNPSIHEDFQKILATRDTHKLYALADRIFGNQISSTPAEGFEIDSAYQGQEALALVRKSVESEKPYAVVFLDIRMPPGWDGVDTLGKIWQVDPRVQVVLCTAYSDYSWEQIAAKIGHSDQLLILTKPFTVTEIRQLAYALTTKWRLARESEQRVNDLEHRVAERTRDLEAVNAQLRKEIAERSRAESALRKAQRLEALGRMAAGIGHEINNPLTFLSANIEMARERMQKVYGESDGNACQEIDELLESAFVGADRIAKIVRNISMVARPNEDAAESVDIASSIQLALKMIRSEINDHVEVITDVGNIPPVLGRRVEIEQLFLNLIKNAAHAVANVHKRPAQVRITSRVESKDRVAIEIVDTGIGIDQEHLEKIFDPFFTTKPVNQGTGLGLSICHAIVSGLGGSIDIRSIKNEGTTVTIQLPASCLNYQEVVAKPATPAPPPLRKSPGVPMGRILVVDDEPLILRALAANLRMHDVTCVDNGREALSRCMSESFDLILCDVMMPGVSGKDLYELLKQARPQLAERIIFITGGSLVTEVREFFESVPNSYIEKPITREVLLSNVEQHLRKIAGAAAKPAAKL